MISATTSDSSGIGIEDVACIGKISGLLHSAYDNNVIGADVCSEDSYTHKARETAEFIAMPYGAMGCSADAGNLDFSGSGIEAFTCSDETYIKSGTELTLSDTSDCMSSKVEVTQVLYCSDNDQVQVSVKDLVVPLPIVAKLNKVACASAEEFAICTGDADPMISAGTFDFSGTGIEVCACTGKTMTKSGQEITISDSSDCLPSGIVVSDAK